MKTRSLLTCLLLAMVVAARAFVVEYNNTAFPQRWVLTNATHVLNPNVLNPNTHAIRYFLASDAYSQANKSAELNAVRAALAQWESIPGASIAFEEAGFIAPGYDVNTADNTNVIYWVKTNTIVDNGTADLSGLLGLTFISTFTSDNSIAQADIVFNGVDFQWFTDFNDVGNTNHFVEATATHEVGHFLGLDHSPAGAATMLWHGLPGIDYQAGLTADEIAAARYLYPSPTNKFYYGSIGGKVSLNTTNLLQIAKLMQTTNLLSSTNLTGVVVTALDAHGNVAGSTVSLTNGTYLIPSLPPGTYTLQATPLDMPTADYPLIQGPNISYGFYNAFTFMLPTTNVTASVTPGVTNRLNFLVTPGIQPFSLSFLRDPTGPSQLFYSLHSGGIQIYAGQTNFTIGAGGFNLPLTDVTLGVSGDGIDFGNTSVDTLSFPGLTVLTVPINIHPDVVPGLRTLTVTGGGFTYSAPGYLRIRPTTPDFNFDGLDDRFQRQYFALWTSPEAGPFSDPDLDGFNNLSEYIAGTDPTDKHSVPLLDSVTETQNGALLAWTSQPNKTFQVLAKDSADQATWQPVGNKFVSSANASAAAASAAGMTPAPVGKGFRVLYFDATATNGMRFYRVEALAQ